LKKKLEEKDSDGAPVVPANSGDDRMGEAKRDQPRILKQIQKRQDTVKARKHGDERRVARITWKIHLTLLKDRYKGNRTLGREG